MCPHQSRMISRRNVDTQLLQSILSESVHLHTDCKGQGSGKRTVLSNLFPCRRMLVPPARTDLTCKKLFHFDGAMNAATSHMSYLIPSTYQQPSKSNLFHVSLEDIWLPTRFGRIEKEIMHLFFPQFGDLNCAYNLKPTCKCMQRSQHIRFPEVLSLHLSTLGELPRGTAASEP